MINDSRKRTYVQVEDARRDAYIQYLVDNPDAQLKDAAEVVQLKYPRATAIWRKHKYEIKLRRAAAAAAAEVRNSRASQTGIGYLGLISTTAPEPRLQPNGLGQEEANGQPSLVLRAPFSTACANGKVLRQAQAEAHHLKTFDLEAGAMKSAYEQMLCKNAA